MSSHISRFYNKHARWIWPNSAQVRIGLVLTLLALATALLGPIFAPYAPTELVGMAYGKPTAGAPLGYDVLGRDVLSRVLAGGQSVVWMSLAASAIALLIGSSLGILGALIRRKTDQVITWFTDVFIAFPDLILVLLIVSLLGREHWLIVLTVALAFIPGVIRLSRSIALGVVS